MKDVAIPTPRLKIAIKARLRQSGGRMFKNVNELLESAFAMHHEQEDRLSVENHERPHPGLNEAVGRERARQERLQRQEDDEDESGARTEGGNSSAMETNNTTTASEESHDEGTITVTVFNYKKLYFFRPRSF